MNPRFVASAAAPRKVALIMGLANQRSIAMSCMESFLQQGDWDVILTMQNEMTRTKVQKIIEQRQRQSPSTISNGKGNGRILGNFVCDVSDPRSTEVFFRESLPETLLQKETEQRNLQAVIHSIAFCPELRKPLLETSREAFLEAHEISAYSLIQVARESLPFLDGAVQGGNENDNSSSSSSSTSSITTLSYLGAERAIPGYNAMGPAKASLESIVRGLALELGQQPQPDRHDNDDDTTKNGNPPIVRVNAVRAGPIPTISAKGGIQGFDRMREDVRLKAPLGNVSASEVAATVYHVAAEADGMTGQTITIDGGYSTVGGPAAPY